MNRREALKNVALLLGGTVINSSAFLMGCHSNNDEQFTPSDIKLMDEIAETIIPATDTPGAKAAGVGCFMAMMVSDCYSEINQHGFHQGLAKIDQDFETEYGYSFLKGKRKERQKMLSGLDLKVKSYNQTKKQPDPEHYFTIMKELTLLGYFTSEIGATQARRYIQTPGSFDSCIDYKKGSKAWTNRIPGSS